MNLNDVLNFLTPQWTDPLQSIFFLIILAMIAGTIISAHTTANARSWERKWNRGTPGDKSDDLDIEHGSVTDLWQAVATAPEKLADIMPSMLLVIGLLGTFLGLGIALNEASTILGKPGAMSADGAAQSMEHLVNMLQGLGTKFKTSTWGISGFVLLKIWSEATRFPEKRLTWVIAKVKTELEHRKKEESAAAVARQNALFSQIGKAATTISSGFAEQLQHLARLQTTLHKDAQLQVEQRGERLFAELGSLQESSRESSAAILHFTSGVEGVISNMGDASQRMAAGADKVGDAAQSLTGTVDAFSTRFTEVLDKVCTDLGAAIQHMSQQASDTFKEGSLEMKNATSQISASLEGLSKDVTKTMTSVDESIKHTQQMQIRASTEFSQSSEALSTHVEKTNNLTDRVTKSITDGLEGVSSANRKISALGATLQGSLDQMGEIIIELAKLPPALEPLANHSSGQQQIQQSLHALSGQQADILDELRAMHKALVNAVNTAGEDAAEAAAAVNSARPLAIEMSNAE